MKLRCKVNSQSWTVNKIVIENVFGILPDSFRLMGLYSSIVIVIYIFFQHFMEVLD